MLAESNAIATTDRPRGPAAADWRAAVAPDAGRAIAQLVSTLALLALSLGLEYWLLDRSVWLSLALAPISGGLLVRTFIFMHDCAHGSFLPWKRATEIVGYVTGVLTLTPFGQWRRDTRNRVVAQFVRNALVGQLPTHVGEIRIRTHFERQPGALRARAAVASCTARSGIRRACSSGGRSI